MGWITSFRIGSNPNPPFLLAIHENFTMHRCCPPWSAPLWTIFLLVAHATGNSLLLQAADRPNVILVITDDQGYGDVGAHGNEMINTPNLDKLYKQSLRLTNYHVDPTCSPTRSALMTGRYSSRTGVWHTIMGRSMMASDETTIAEVFADAGYRCGMTGKWHLGDCYPLRPQEQGFHETLHHGGGGIGQTPDYWGNDYFDDHYTDGKKWIPYKGYCTDRFFDWGIDFVTRNKEKPFFLYIATNVPHGPFNVDKKYSDAYEAKGVPGTMAKFYGMIENFDENMGRLTAKLDELKLADNTILIFTTDNGTAAGMSRGNKTAKWNGFNDGMRGQKGSEYDGGHRVPFFIRWPGKIEAGRDLPLITAHIDVLPTLASLCGVDLPESLQQKHYLDGRSLRPLIFPQEGSGAEHWPNRTLTVHSQRIETPEKWRKSAVMTNRWRLVNGKELYDMNADPGQAEDVAADHPDIVKLLTAQYETWWKHIDDRFDDYVRIPLGASEANPTSFTCHDWHANNVPWNHGQISRMPKANGYWAVDVKQAGKYEVTLRLRPSGTDFPLQKGTAKVTVGDVEQSNAITPGASEAVVTLDLPAGPAKLQTWLEEENRGSRGAYFITVKRVE